MNISPIHLVLRCYAVREEGQWQAVCLDLCLGSQADSFEVAKSRLEAMIYDYIYDALAGEDKAFADQLIPRRAPLGQWLKYYGYVIRSRMGAVRDEVWRLFTQAVPLVPDSAHKHA